MIPVSIGTTYRDLRHVRVRTISAVAFRDSTNCAKTPRPRSGFDRGLGSNSSGRLRQEELAGDFAPLLHGELHGQIVDGRAAVLGNDTGESGHACLQAAGSICHPLAG